MTPETVMTLARQALELMLMVAAPPLAVALTVGLAIGLLQAITQVHEATLSFLPKFVAISATIGIAGPWMLSLLVDFLQQTLVGIPTRIG